MIDSFFDGAFDIVGLKHVRSDFSNRKSLLKALAATLPDLEDKNVRQNTDVLEPILSMSNRNLKHPYL